MLNLVANSPSGYTINNSLRFRASASASLTRTMSASGTITTWSMWVKRGTLGTTQALVGFSYSGTTSFGMQFNSDNTLNLYNYSSAFTLNLTTTQVFRDPSAWYHLVFTIDTTQATASNRAKIYVNGSQVTAFGTATYPSQNSSLNIGTSTSVGIGVLNQQATQYLDGYLAEFNLIDGQALTPSSFGQTSTTTGVWQPKQYTGTYGTNGFYLKFSDIATTSGSNAGLGKDYSGNANYWTTNNISVTSGSTYDAMIDSPTNASSGTQPVGNYCTLNYIDTNTASSISGANLNWVDAGGIDREIRGTIGVFSGKYYWETVLTSSNTSHVGVDTVNSPLLVDYLGSTSTSWSIYLGTGNKRNSASNTAYGSSFAVNDVMMCALDMDNGKIWWGKNGTWFASGDPAAGTNAAFTNLSGYTLAFAATPRSSCSANFGQRPFSYTPPSGFKSLCTTNLPDSTIVQGNKYMDATLYTGTGSNPRSVTNTASFKPDFVWIKSRSTADWHILSDSVRGANNVLYSNSTASQQINEANGYLSAFNSNGFSVTNGGTSSANVNANGTTYVGWQWQAGQGTTSSNTSGSITSTVSVNATAGFSVVTWTGTGANATVGHGLGVAPKMIFIKNRTSGSLNWGVYNATVGNTKVLLLNTTAAASAADPSFWNNTSPTSTTFSLSTWPEANNSGNSFVAYCFAAISGYSAFGSYTGNGSSDGVFSYLGFLPKLVLIKRTDTTGNWYMWDTARNTYNVLGEELYPNLSNAGSTATDLDVLSNGFKMRNTTAGFNASGGTYVYAAWASNPFKNSLAF